MDIHPKFSYWLSLAKITPPDETIRKWWSALDGLTPDRNNILTLVGRARQLDPGDINDTWFLPAIQQADAAFLPTHKIGLAVLAATKLHVMIENDESAVDDLAKLLTSVSFPSFEKHPAFLADLSALAESKFSDWSRNRADWSLIQATRSPEMELDDLRRIVAVAAEETNMLWWLFGKRSRDLDLPFADVAAESVGLLVAKELADLTTLLPGPAAIKAIADRAIHDDRAKAVEQVSLAQSVRSLPDAWKASFITRWSGKPFLQHCRIARAIHGATAATTAKWPSAFSTLTGWPKDHKLPVIQLANLFYRECLVLSAWQQAGT